MAAEARRPILALHGTVRREPPFPTLDWRPPESKIQACQKGTLAFVVFSQAAVLQALQIRKGSGFGGHRASASGFSTVPLYL